ncbi:unnamed protein product [Oreochromis niloticus]|nr:unnamed protein product [Mustela putorius furo]
MESSYVVKGMDITVCPLLTILLILWLCFVVQREQVLVTYYTNLLLSNLIQFGVMIFWKSIMFHEYYTTGIIFDSIYLFGVMANLEFKMCIAAERCFLITCPQLNCIRQTKGSLLVSVLVWILCVITASLCIVLNQHFLITILVFNLSPLFILSFAWTLRALPSATSVPTDEKRRVLGTLVVLLLNHFLMIFPMAVCYTLIFKYCTDFPYSVISLFLLSPFMDLVLFVFMHKGPIDRLLARLCCCGMDNTVGNLSVTPTVTTPV